jgi:SAM-dependent methyltransferase
MNKQKKHFNNKNNQFSTKSIINPPRHNIIEMQNILNYINKNHKNELVVDFGAGTGRLSMILLKANYNVLAIDISKNSLNQLKINAKTIGRRKQIKTANAFNKNVYSIICGTDILHHVNIKKYFQIFFANLKQNGSIVFSEPNCLNPAWLFIITLLSSWKVELGIFQCSYFNIVKKLKLSGFNHIQIKGIGLLPLPILNWSKTLTEINLFIGNLPILKVFAYRYIIIARK